MRTRCDKCGSTKFRLTKSKSSRNTPVSWVFKDILTPAFCEDCQHRQLVPANEFGDSRDENFSYLKHHSTE